MRNRVYRAFTKLSQVMFNSFKRFKKGNGHKVLVFTDSRGTEINGFKQRNPFFSYLSFLSEYTVQYVFCPEKYTSILDYIDLVESNALDFDYVVLHCGIVDFAPRPLSSYNEMLDSKKDIIKRYGWERYFYDRHDFHCDYEGEKTIQFLSLDFLKNEISTRTNLLNNVIYIGINRVLLDWNGTYFRERPDCINTQLKHDDYFSSLFERAISLRDWNDEDIKKYTSDNVHYKRSGLVYIGRAIKDELEVLISKA
jgi:hypothetical protein